MLQEAGWPELLLRFFRRPFQASDAYPEQRARSECIDPLVKAYELLAVFDANLRRVPSYREQLASAISAANWDMTRAVAPAVIALRKKFDGAGRKHPAFRFLLQAALEALRKATAEPNTSIKDWKVTTSLNCSCNGCGKVKAILLDPMRSSGTVNGSEPELAHIRSVLEIICKKHNSDFSFVQEAPCPAREVPSTAPPTGLRP